MAGRDDRVLDPDVGRAIWDRDRYRCTECGIAVAGARGCKPQTHHIHRRQDGGSDNPANLTTLCYFCHATKQSRGHPALLANATPELMTDLIKWLLWDLATNLVRYAEWLPPRLIGDKAYDSDPLDETLTTTYGIELIARHRDNRQRPPTQDDRPLRRRTRRWKSERVFAWFHHSRRLVTRWEYHAENFLAFVHLACIRILLEPL
jgi:transposase